MESYDFGAGVPQKASLDNVFEAFFAPMQDPERKKKNMAMENPNYSLEIH